MSAVATPVKSAAASGRAETAAMTRAVRMLAMLFLQNMYVPAAVPVVREIRLLPGQLADRPGAVHDVARSELPTETPANYP
ncbi:hypothetical protein GCM10022232_23310 [Streptomyces plumbiresistens]|uniref:Uncharacterized protein n=1 Tax=Streptomyces plumbiresistens TaxID=511811 RepID=A0ABP7QXY8_9ACTN